MFILGCVIYSIQCIRHFTFQCQGQLTQEFPNDQTIKQLLINYGLFEGLRTFASVVTGEHCAFKRHEMVDRLRPKNAIFLEDCITLSIKVRGAHGVKAKNNNNNCKPAKIIGL